MLDIKRYMSTSLNQIARIGTCENSRNRNLTHNGSVLIRFLKRISIYKTFKNVSRMLTEGVEDASTSLYESVKALAFKFMFG